MYFLRFHVVPTRENKYFNDVEAALVPCWVEADDPISAINYATFKIEQYDWKVTELETAPFAITEADCSGNPVTAQLYKKGAEIGIAMEFHAWSKDGTTRSGPTQLDRSDDFPLSSYVTDRKRMTENGRCLHFDAGVRCNNIIDAHSIQRNGALSMIANDGQVYAPSSNLNDIRRANGSVVFSRQQISRISTFRGFCQAHDQELFRPIDTQTLIPSHQQICLYAYRSICRELFVKENAVVLSKEYFRKSKRNRANRQFFEAMRDGNTLALNNLRSHKKKYDLLLETHAFDEIEYTIFCSEQAPTMVFSGLLYPDSDFLGEPLQNLLDVEADSDLITFCFAPMDLGWAFIFAWHRSSSAVCTALIRSLATTVSDNKDLGDQLFRYVVLNCENLAASPEWWQTLTEPQQREVARKATYWADMFSPHHHDYLVRGLEGLSGWRFNNVLTNIQPTIQ